MQRAASTSELCRDFDREQQGFDPVADRERKRVDQIAAIRSESQDAIGMYREYFAVAETLDRFKNPLVPFEGERWS